jgi:3-oxoacyl-[acyl-carrier-protein] synthase-3
MIMENTDIAICGISAVVPKRVVPISHYIDFFPEKKVRIQEQVTGIHQRHIASECEHVGHFCLQAARRLLDEMKVSREEIRVLLLVTQTSPYITPSTSFWIHKELGLDKDCIVFDMNLGCSGFVDGLNTMACILAGMDEGAKGLLLNGDTLSKYIDESDFGTCMMFGDVGTATLLEKKKGSPFLCHHNVKSSGFDQLIIKNHDSKLYMNGMEVFHFAINDVVEQIQDLLSDERKEMVDFFVLHQAQEYIVRNISELCEMPEQKVLCCCGKYGNVSGASIPLAICENNQKFLDKKTFRLFVSGFGAGLSYSSAIVEMRDAMVLSVENYASEPEGEDVS